MSTADRNCFVSRGRYYVAGLDAELKRLRGTVPKKAFHEALGIALRTLGDIERDSAVSQPQWAKLLKSQVVDTERLNSLCPEGWGGNATSPTSWQVASRLKKSQKAPLSSDGHKTQVTAGLIDTTTIYGTIACMDRQPSLQDDPWAVQNARQLLAAISLGEGLYIAQPSSILVRRTGALAGFVKLLKERGCAVKESTATDKDKEGAREAAKTWVRAHLGTISGERLRLRTEERAFKAWIEWHVEHVWEEHCHALDGLATPEFRDEVAAVLGLDLGALQKINDRAKDSSRLSDLVCDKDGLKRAKDVYVVSALIRGVYYGCLADRMEEHFVAHQIRENCLPGSPSDPKETYGMRLGEAFLNEVLLRNALRQATLNDRLAALAHLAGRARRLRRAGQLTIADSSERVAADDVLKIAREKFHLQVGPRDVERAIAQLGHPSSKGIIRFMHTLWGTLAAKAASLPRVIAAPSDHHFGEIGCALPGSLVPTKAF